jgi:beta-galactosidase/evolved beta-galactosidase subunit alpha
MPEAPLSAADHWLNLRFLLASDTPWAGKGHEVAWAQFRLPVPVPQAPRISCSSMGPVRIDESSRSITVETADSALVFDRLRGTIGSWRYGGIELVRTGPRLSFWRAPTDNDVHEARKWRKDGLHRLQHRIDSVECGLPREGAARVVVHTRIAPPVLAKGFLCEYTYTVYGSGDVILAVRGTPQGQFATLPRIGLDMALDESLDSVSWYGNGPGESYVDSKQAQRVGLFSCGVDDLLTPYVFPQENGNRTDVRWVTLTDRRGSGLLAAAVPLMNFSAHRFTAADFEAANHTVDLTPRREIVCRLDYRHHGLGSASCGPGVLPPYVLRGEGFRFAVRLRPLCGGPASAWDLYKMRLEEV